jgi:hypothetical protein
MMVGVVLGFIGYVKLHWWYFSERRFKVRKGEIVTKEGTDQG